jgi:hypothetical protein
MNARLAAVVVLASALLAFPSIAVASRSGSHTSHATHTKSSGTHTSTKPRESKPSRAVTAPRDSHGRIKRSEAARSEFMRGTGYAHGRPGYVVDHITPLACGGADAPSNMQWQTIAEAKAKDRTERAGCR